MSRRYDQSNISQPEQPDRSIGDLSEFEQGDDVYFEYELPNITMTDHRRGKVVESVPHPKYEHVLFVVVDLPTRLVEYEVRQVPESGGEQVTKRIADERKEIGKFGPVINIRSA